MRLKRTHYLMLQCLSEAGEPILVGDVAAWSGMSYTTVSIALTELEGAGYITKRETGEGNRVEVSLSTRTKHAMEDRHPLEESETDQTEQH